MNVRHTIYRLIAGLAMGLIFTACGQAPTTSTPTCGCVFRSRWSPVPNAARSASGSISTEAPEETLSVGQIGEDDEIILYNWTEYIDPEMYAIFQEETGIEVTEDNYSSNEELLAKLQGGATGYALIVPSDYMVAIMIEEGMLAELDHDNIPNLANLEERFRNTPIDPGNKYCAPYQWGTTGIGYNSAELDAPESWAAIFAPPADAPYLGRFTMLDDSREAFAAALLYLGYDINTKEEAQLQEAKEVLIAAKANIHSYDSDTFEDQIGVGETLLAHGWNGEFANAEYDNIDYLIPEEGGVIWIDYICIPATIPPEKKAAAEQFINFLLRPDMGALLTEWNYYSTPNKAAEELLTEDILTNPIVYPPEDVRARLHFIEPVGEATELYERLWDEVKSAPTP